MSDFPSPEQRAEVLADAANQCRCDVCQYVQRAGSHIPALIQEIDRLKLALKEIAHEGNYHEGSWCGIGSGPLEYAKTALEGE